MTYGSGAQAYTQAQVATSTNQQQLIVMAYDGILRFLRKAREHMDRGEIEEKHNALVRARAIVEELAATLNLELGGEIARNLWNLYVFFMKRISEANVLNDASLLDEILPAIKELHDAWAEMQVPEEDAQAQALNRRVLPPDQSHRLSVTG